MNIFVLLREYRCTLLVLESIALEKYAKRKMSKSMDKAKWFSFLKFEFIVWVWVVSHFKSYFTWHILPTFSQWKQKSTKSRKNSSDLCEMQSLLKTSAASKHIVLMQSNWQNFQFKIFLPSFSRLSLYSVSHFSLKY